MLKRSIISLVELYEVLTVTGDSTTVVVMDEFHRELARGFWFCDDIIKYNDMICESFTYSAPHDELRAVLMNYTEPDNSAAY